MLYFMAKVGISRHWINIIIFDSRITAKRIEEAKKSIRIETHKHTHSFTQSLTADNQCRYIQLIRKWLFGLLLFRVSSEWSQKWRRCYCLPSNAWKCELHIFVVVAFLFHLISVLLSTVFLRFFLFVLSIFIIILAEGFFL